MAKLKKSNEEILLKANPLVDSYPVERNEERRGKEVQVDLVGNTLIFKEIEIDIINVILKNIQRSIFYNDDKNDLDNYKAQNPLSVSISSIKKELKLKGASSTQLIAETMVGLRNKDIILKDLIHPFLLDEFLEPVKYSRYHTSIFAEVGFRVGSQKLQYDTLSEENDKEEIAKFVQGVSADAVVDVVLGNIFYYLLKKPTERVRKFSDYEKFAHYKKTRNQFSTEEEIKKEFELLSLDNKKRIPYTSINTNSVRSIKSKYGKKLYEILCFKISYQIKSRKTVNYGYFKYRLYELNLMFGMNETGLRAINRIMSRNFMKIKKFVIKDLDLEDINYESDIKEKEIVFSFTQKEKNTKECE